MGHEHFPISPGIERRGHKSRVMQYKKIRELADRKRGIIKKKEEARQDKLSRLYPRELNKQD